MHDQQDEGPRAERDQQRHEEIALRAGMIDRLLTEKQQRDKGHAKHRHAQLGTAGLIDNPARPIGPYCLCGDHSSSPRRMPSATAAARSDTPSFSYSRA